MKLPFKKYQATGNDFVVVDNRDGGFRLTIDEIKRICDRKFGVGADGVMLIERDATSDFNLVYYNSDGTQSLCGNGSRAAVKMAASLGLVKQHTTFNAYDGLHEADVLDADIVRLKMNDVTEVKQMGQDVFLNTGSPHLVKFVTNVKDHPVVAEGRTIRYSETFKPKGTNVNFAELRDNNTIFVRTYERGVEDETLSCGTGVTAVVLAASLEGYTSPVRIKALGGDLSVEFERNGDGSFKNIYLIGPARMVFAGEIEI